MRAIGLRSSLVVATLLLAICAFSLHAAADTGCPAGTRPATTADVAYMKINGIPDATIGMCWNPDDKTVGKSDAEAKQYLISLYTNPGPCSQKGLSNPQVEGIQRLDSQFAINLAAMLRAAPMKITINSAFRTQAGQACANPTVKNSRHSLGCAVDLGYSQKSCTTTACQWVRANASKYNLQIRMQYSPEWNHIEPFTCAGKSTGSIVSSGDYSTTEDANQISNPIVPNGCVIGNGSYLYPSQGCYSAQLPSTLPAATVAPASTQTVTPTTVGTPTGTTQPQVCSPSYSCSGGTMYYQTSSCTTQVYQLCVYGCDGNTCKTASTTSSAIGSDISGAYASTSSSTSDDAGDTNTNTNSNTNISDILDSLSIGDMFTATEVGTSAPLSLNPSIFQSSSLQDPSTQYPAGTLVASGTIASVQPIGGQSTFTSQDLANNPGYVPAQSNSAVFSILEGMKNALLGALNFLLSLGH